VLSALCVWIAGANDFRMLYIAVWLMFLYAAYHALVLKPIFPFRRDTFFRTVGLSALPVALAMLLNVFWILPLSMTGSLVDNDVLGRSLFGNGFLDMAKSITLFHPFWIDGRTDWFVEQTIPSRFWLIPTLAFL
jgi:hypothetical protein